MLFRIVLISLVFNFAFAQHTDKYIAEFESMQLSPESTKMYQETIKYIQESIPQIEGKAHIKEPALEAEVQRSLNNARSSPHYQEMKKQAQKSIKHKQIKLESDHQPLLTKDYGINPDRVINEYSNILEQSTDNDLFVFISLSMPQQLLRDLDKQIGGLGGKLVLRGMYLDSMSKTIKKIHAIGLHNVIIHPQLFKQFNIELVPTVVVGNGPSFDKVVGNITLYNALELLYSKGDFPLQSYPYYNRIRLGEQ